MGGDEGAHRDAYEDVGIVEKRAGSAGGRRRGSMEGTGLREA
jgi:hypothetical protein